MVKSMPNIGYASSIRYAQASEKPLEAPAASNAARKQIFQNSCGAASLLCIAKELGIEKMPAYEGSLSGFTGGNLELSNACEQDLFTITSGMTTQRRQRPGIQEAGYSLPQHLVFAGQLLGLEMVVHESPGFFSSALNWLYPKVKKELAPGTVIKPHAPELRHGEAELKALAVSIAKVPIGLHWVVHRADGSFMDPGTGKNAANFDEMQRNMRAESVSFMGYSDTGISIVARKGGHDRRP
jgi:cysteine protease IpaJ